MNEQLRSGIEKNYSSQYDTRFNKIQESGELFDPMLNRYDSIIRHLCLILEGFAMPTGEVERYDGKVYYYAAPSPNSPFYELKAGMKLYDSITQSKYDYSEKVKQIYGDSLWEGVLRELKLEGIVTFDSETRSHRIVPSEIRKLRYRRSYNSRQEYFNSPAKLVNDVFTKVLNDLAYESFKNLKGWQPHKFNTKESWRNITDWNPEDLWLERDRALVALANLRESYDDLYSIEMLFRHSIIEDIMHRIKFNNTQWLREEVHAKLDNINSDLANLVEYCAVYVKKKLRTRRNFNAKYRQLSQEKDKIDNFDKVVSEMSVATNVTGNSAEFKATSMFDKGSESSQVNSKVSAQKMMREVEDLENNTKSSVPDRDTARQMNELQAELQLSYEREKDLRSKLAGMEKQQEGLQQCVLTMKNVVGTFASSLSDLQQQIDDLMNKF